MELKINFVAILVTLVANFFVGMIWYMPLFGRAWSKEMKIDMTEKPSASLMIKGMAFGAIGNFLLAFVFAHNIAAWSFVPDMPVSPVSNILSAAMFTWLGFFVPVGLNRVAWEGNSWKLFFINEGAHLLQLFVAATILTLWK